MGDSNTNNLIMSTLLEIRGDIGGLKSDVSHIKESINTSNNLLQQHVAADEKVHKEQDDQITKVTDKQKKLGWFTAGIAGGAGAVISTVAWALEILTSTGRGH